MSSLKTRKLPGSTATDSKLLQQVAREGFGAEAWHGPNFSAAAGDVAAELAFWRPGKGRHNIAEIVLHHAYTIWGVRKQLAGPKGVVEPFLFEGDGWWELGGPARISWQKILDAAAAQQAGFEDALAGRARPPEDVKVFDLVLGVTCHAVYHAGQIQLIKKLRENA